MALFKSGNPMLKEKTYEGTIFSGLSTGKEMTVKGTLNKFGFLMIMMLGTTLFSWDYFYKGNNPLPLIIISTIAGLALIITMSFKKQWSPFLAPAYALAEGLFVGSASAYYEYVYGSNDPGQGVFKSGIVMQAVLLTMVVTMIMFLIYRSGIIKVTKKFKSILLITTSCIVVFYLIQLVSLWVFHYEFAAFTFASTPIGIAFSVVIIVVASLNLLINFDMIKKGAENKVPKYMEWYSAAGLLVTIVWLYLEILRFIAKITRG